MSDRVVSEAREASRIRLFLCGFSFLLFAAFPSSLLGQFDMMIFQSQAPQAQCRQELDSFLDIVEATQAEGVISSAARFKKQFPESEFLSQVHRMEMKAYKGLNDYKNTVGSGERALAINPHDVDTLLTLANVLPHGVKEGDDSQDVLSKAENYARRALDNISSLKAARTVSLADWLDLISQMKSSAHEALGMIAFKRGRYSESVAELEEGTRLNPVADGAQYFKLGTAYLLNGDPAKAKTALERAFHLGPEVVKSLAQEQLLKVEKKKPKTPGLQ
jgi:tetratricopeptide (TPR) repeat protein